MSTIMEETKDNILDRKISVYHLIYVLVICCIFIITALVVLPGRINNDAYQNFSFAATVTSIVLAVVSIVYSLQSGLKSSSQMESIRGIEQSISNEIKKFSDIDEKIRQALDPISDQVGDIKKAQGDLKQAQDSLQSEMLKITSISFGKGDEGVNLEGPKILSVVLFAAARSMERGMDMPYHRFFKHIGAQSRYCEGLLDGLSAVQSVKIKVEEGSKPWRKKVTEFDVKIYGSADDLKKRAIDIADDKTKKLINDIDDYFSDIKNQLNDENNKE